MPLSALPTTVITGYLGSGKTTLINRLLAGDHGLRITVLVNDFGEIAIDESLIKNRDGDTLTLSNGCICCSIGGALYDSIDQILNAENRPDHLVIETSGVADPAKVSDIAVAEPDLDYFGTLCLMDCMNLEHQLADPLLRDTLERQMRGSQVLVFTKTDLHDGSDALRDLRTLALSMHHEKAKAGIQSHGGKYKTATQSMFDAIQGNLPFGTVLANHCDEIPTNKTTTNPLVNKSSMPSNRSGFDGTADHQALYAAWSGPLPGRVDTEQLAKLSAPDTTGIYRLKGFVRNPEGHWMEVHRVGSQWTASPVTAPPRSSSSSCGHLVAIGFARSFNENSFEALLLSACKNAAQPA